MTTHFCILFFFFFFNDTATTEIYTLSLHDALPISPGPTYSSMSVPPLCGDSVTCTSSGRSDRKSTRLNSSHVEISYAVFCLKKKNIASGSDTASLHTYEHTHD